MDGATSLNPFQTLPIFTLVLITPFILGDDNSGATLPFPTLEDAAAATSSPPGLSTNNYSPSDPFKPRTGVLVGVLTTTFSLTFLFLLYIKHCNDANNFANANTNSQQPSHVRKNSGIDRDVLESLPVFKFGSLKGQKNGLDCAVCLSRFEDPEVLRLLPKCRHAFHVECVDAWLDAHSTCPLCRYKVEPNDVVVLVEDDAKAKCNSEGESDVNDDASRGENENAETTSSLDSAEHRLEHRIVVSPRGGVHQRWSDFQQRDVLYLTSEMVTWKARGDSSSSNSNVVVENGGAMKNLRSVSEVTGMRNVQGLLILF